MTVETLPDPTVERTGTPMVVPHGDALPPCPSVTPMTLAPSLAVGFRHVGSVCILSLQGTLTAHTVAVFESQIDRLGRTPCHRVVIDVAGLAAMDDTGLRVLTGLHHYVQARGGRLSVIGAVGSVVNVLASAPLFAG